MLGIVHKHLVACNFHHWNGKLLLRIEVLTKQRMVWFGDSGDSKMLSFSFIEPWCITFDTWVWFCMRLRFMIIRSRSLAQAHGNTQFGLSWALDQVGACWHEGFDTLAQFKRSLCHRLSRSSFHCARRAPEQQRSSPNEGDSYSVSRSNPFTSDHATILLNRARCL